MSDETNDIPQEDIDNEFAEAADKEAAVNEDAASKDSGEELSVEDQLAAAIAELDAANDKAVRAQAELENFRRRSQKESEQNAKYSGMFLIRDFLPGLDNLGRAVQAAESTGNADELIQGVKMVAKQFEDILGRYSAIPIKAEGEPFDPNRHEAIQQIPTDEHPPMTVLQEVERGYILHDRVIRPTKVLVSAAPPKPAEPEAESTETSDDE